MDIYDMATSISNKADFVEFLRMLKHDFLQNPAEWQNNTLPSFLEGIYGYCTDMQDVDAIDWKVVADILLAATVYE